MTRHPRLSLLLAAALLLPAAALAQTIGGAVPPYQPPAPAAVPPARPADSALDPASRPDPFRRQDDLALSFADVYLKAGRPRLAFYWNRQLTDTLAQWQSDSRVVTSSKASRTSEGDYSQRQQRTSQAATETQRRVGDVSGRPAPAETWEWEFQDGFLGPFLGANAEMVDRAAIIRIMGAGAEDIDSRAVEVMALQNMADLLVEVLVADSAQSSSGYELRARILDVRTGAIVAMVNSRSLREWRNDGGAVATSTGFELPDEDDEAIGPRRQDRRYKATSTGFEVSRKPPRVELVARNLAYNVMIALIPRLEGRPADQPPAAAAPAPASVSGPGGARASQSALPRPEVDSQPLPAPDGATAAEEPPMPRPTTR